MKRAVVVVLAKVDETFDLLLYRPAVVRAFLWLPRWWLCDLARLSIRLDERWNVGWWDEIGIFPGQPCEACDRRASIHVYGGLEADEPTGAFIESRRILLCGWCRLDGPVCDDDDIQRELARARARSVAWRWRSVT